MIHEELMIAGMAIATFSIRYVIFGTSRHITLSPSLLNALRYVPPVVLTAIVVPEVLMSDGGLDMSWMNARLVGAIAAVLIATTTQNLLFTIGLGMAIFFGWNGFLNLLL
ncbi:MULTISPECIES: AzlD domain-containing protein [unclassified Roseofilum]|uniref:AzlD domain-containing protein n=1 Tax=unclassified Roseofilum TaxID=2620099 RepID=UPI001B010215|nr:MULTISPECIES: AzlD domain-containing protein [unclassified Roseofilum]MBP0007909.1 AzlD domain-containing protein [Roseofilum sp. Belize Diploria]MBP0014034.1 AzlD domain-containing protein [Roseofilum sp. SID3]MBP0023080.1 AzlD domain-containing protein [Roseofilum sp. SID2]MBP0032316.1 AzlD domain-containing protein [Roseofilum sp. Belize BBD 4]MBP0040119.1 AzlD domain-containing protein [Roseofilum sp. SID1]